VRNTYYVVDADDRITRVAGALRESLAQFVGHSIWEASPQAEPLFSAHFERARETGEEVEFDAFYAGRLARRRIVPTGNSLTVYVTVLRELDVRTLATLAESLRAIEAELAGRASEPPDPRSRASLQALP
jgi:hypothetical protein